ncbi:MAG: metallophosphoesterase [Butyrivibrio sp.]|jgi:predicted MPP superfamily phosphohydrolase|nr:metallophosphoesterase [Butyrivibrio sp.]
MQLALIIILIILAAFFTAVIWRDMHRFVIRSYEICSDKITRDVRLCLISDLHGKDYDDGNQCLISAVGKEHPDVVLVAGDMITSQNPCTKSGDVALHLLTALAAQYPVFLANGNHEYKTEKMTEWFGSFYETYARQLKEAGVVILQNESIYLERDNICITGLEMRHRYYHRFYKHKMDPEYLNETLGTPVKRQFQLLIAHNPMYFEEYADWGADLTVSGHVHGGIVRLPLLGGVISPALILFPKYDGGRYDRNGKTLILSRGLGTHTIPVRMFNPGEVAIIDLKKCTGT